MTNVFSLLAEFRFPKPDFSDGYETPTLYVPDPTAPWFEYLSLGIFIAILVLSALAMYKWRSRKVLMVLMVISIVFFGFIRKGCVCAIGSIGNVSAAVGSPDFPLSIFTVLIFILPLVTALFWGRVFCGAACPFGALQDLMLVKGRRVHPVIDRSLKVIPPIFLGLAIVFAFCDMGFIICLYDPFVGLFRFDLRSATLFFALLFLGLSTFVGRPYCRYLCPYGVLLKIASFFSKRHISIINENSSCINCHLCDSACPVNAIEPPPAQKKKKPIAAITQRVQMLLVTIPLFIALGAFLGASISDQVSQRNFEVALLQKIENKQLEDEDVVAFMSSQQSLPELQSYATQQKNRIFYGMMIFGGWCGFIISLSLIMAYRRRYNENYNVNKYDCINCVRCYEYCPINSNKTNEK